MNGAARDAGVDLFGFGSRPVRWALVGFAAAYVIVTVGTGLHITSPPRWAGLVAPFLLFVATARHLLVIPDDPCSRRTAWAAAMAVLLAASTAWWSLPTEDHETLQNGPATAGSIVVLTLVAIRGRPGIAWCGALTMSALCGLWAIGRGMGFVSGVAITVWAYPVLVLAVLFLITLRPMATRIAGLREATLQTAATAAAAEAAADQRRRYFEDFERRARPVLESIVRGHDFSFDDIEHTRLLEAQLRDGIRAPGWDSPELRAAVWTARARGVEVVLLDDGALAGVSPGERDAHLHRLAEIVIRELSDGADRVTARILPPGRRFIATVVDEVDGQSRRRDIGPDSMIG